MHLPRPTVVAGLLTVVLLASACDQAQLDEARDAAEQAIEDAASRGEELLDELPTTLPSPEDLLPEPDETAPAEEPAPAEPTEDETVAAPASPEATVAPSPSPAPDDVAATAGVPWWVWVVVLLLVTALVTGVVVAVRRSRERAARRARLRDEALRDAGWLLDVAEEHRAAIDADARARDVRVRTDRLVDTLRTLRTDARAGAVAAADALARSARRLGDTVVAELDDAAANRTGADLDRDALAAEVRADAAALREAVPGTAG